MITNIRALTTQEKDEIEYYASRKKNALLGVGIIFACFWILEFTISKFPDAMLGKIVFQNDFAIMASTLHEVIVALIGAGMLLGVIVAGYFHLKISDIVYKK